MVSALTRLFGVHNISLAEDVVQDAFCRAVEVWKLRGVPENPSAWLMATAKNRALDILRRERTARKFAPDLGRLLESEWTLAPTVAEIFQPHVIKDDQLRMMFSCCQPRLAEAVQVTLILKLLCGFSVGEIAAAFLSSTDAIEKRITRGKKALAGARRLFDLTDADFQPRLAAVHRALYLLFNEGYHGASSESAVRIELCGEAMRLGALLRDHPSTATPVTFALSALMCLHSARLKSRIDDDGKLSALPDQDRSQWDRRLIAEGERLLDLSATGTEVTEYHIEAGIAVMHARARTVEETDWEMIVSLYDRLQSLRPSPVVSLNRAIAVGQLDGPERGLAEIQAIAHGGRLDSYPFYHAALGELSLQVGRPAEAAAHFGQALDCARNAMERAFFQKRIEACASVIIHVDVGL